MTAIPIQVAEAVTAEINAAVTAEVFSLGEFTAERSYVDWDAEFKDLEDMAVDVVFVTSPKDEDVDLNAVGELQYQVAIDVVVRKKFTQSDRRTNASRLRNEAVDPLVLLLQEIHEHFASLRNSDVLPTMPEAKWLDTDAKAWLSNWKLRAGLFEGGIRLHFDVSKEG